MTYVEPLMAISEDRNWKQNYTYGAYGERISMSYVPSGDASNAWEPTPGASGTNSSNALTTLYYLSDVRGSVVGLMDSEGAIAARYHYDEFGSVLQNEKFDLNYPGPDNLFGYTGLGYDYTSGLNHARARYFDASIGRFISEDTYEGDRNDPLSLNLYTYVQNNPLKYVDPSGNIPVLIALLGKALVNYAIDVMIGVGFDYLSYVKSGSSSKFNMTASLKKNAKESAVPGLGFIKKVFRAMKLADDIKAAQKAAKAKKVKSGTSTKGTGKIDLTVKPTAENQKLQNAINQLYRPNATVGNGSTMDAIRHELKTGELVGGKGHLQKGQERVKNLENVLKKEQLSTQDKALAEAYSKI